MQRSIISREPFVPHLFESLAPADQMVMEKSEYTKYVNWFNQCTDAQFERIFYWSNGLRITGILCSPKESESTQTTPLIIYNRGGVGEIGKVTVRTLYKRIYPFVKLGYTVIASQYRGADGSDGVDEIGGNDIYDIESLMPVIESLPSVDSKNLFMMGFSRGAIDTYRVLQRKMVPVRACAVLSGISDLFSFVQSRPDFIPLMKHFIPNYDTRQDEELAKRSVSQWAEDITVPLLLVHGNNDDMVEVSTTKRLASLLSSYHKEYKLIICPDTDHSLDGYEESVTAEIQNWFMKYRS